MARRSKQSRGGEQTRRGDAVGVKIPIENRKCGARMITEHGRVEREACEYDDEQSDASQAQSRMRHATKKPAKSGAFQRPADGAPWSVELDRENHPNRG